MTKKGTSIRINGNHYDALTGALLSSETTPTKGGGKPHAKSIDGVITQPSATINTPTAAPKPKPHTTRTIAVHVKPHSVKPSATLMRHAVAKPTATSLKRHTKVQTSTKHLAHKPSGIVVKQKMSLYSIDQRRAAVAKQTALSPRISRFARDVPMIISRDIEQAAVAINKAIIIPQTAMPSTMYRPDVRRQAPRSPQQKTSDIFEQALLRATSHEEPAPAITTKRGRQALRNLRRRMVTFGAGAVAVMALVGFFGFQTDTMQFKMAANQAGFAATMPKYQPSGFEMAEASVKGGYLSLRYNHAQTQRSFAVTEKPTIWNSETLLAQITSSPKSSNYSAVQKSGRTIYVYGRNQAAWVHNGILYQVVGNGALSTDDFTQIAASM